MVDGSNHLLPRIIPRKGRGYLAISAKEDSLQIGVTADTEADALSKFMATAAQWRALLAQAPQSERPKF